MPRLQKANANTALRRASWWALKSTMPITAGILSGQDLDDVFAYTTAKEVNIRDRRLGVLDLFLMLGWLVGSNFRGLSA